MFYSDEKFNDFPDIELDGNFTFVTTSFNKLNNIDIYPPGFFLEKYSQNYVLAWFHIPLNKKEAAKKGFIFNKKVDMVDSYLVGFLIEINYEYHEGNPGFDSGIFHLNPQGMVRSEGVVNNFQVTYTVDVIDQDTVILSIYGN